MPRMLDLIRASAVTQHQMMSAAKGGLRVPLAETLEILVYLAEHNKIFGEQARLTLAGWDEAAAKQVATDPSAPKEVLDYWTSPKNIRPGLFPILLENPSVPVSKLAELAASLQGELIDAMIASPRVKNSPQVLNDMSTNHNLSGAQAARVQALISGTVYEDLEAERKTLQAEPENVDHEKAQVAAPAPEKDAVAAEAAAIVEETPHDPEAEKAVAAFVSEHAAEIAAAPEKPFQPIGGIHEEEFHSEPPKAAAAAVAVTSATVSTTPSSAPGPATTMRPFTHKKQLVNPQDEQRGSVLQKIAKLDVKGRIQLAMKGNKEERSILVRDGTKIVAIAVLDSPKITDGEVEKFATQKNVLEAVLRAIPMKRRFIKNYAVMRNLVFNPRTPIDVTLGLMKNLLVSDLRNLAGNKEVPDTVTKLALRMFKQKSEASQKK